MDYEDIPELPPTDWEQIASQWERKALALQTDLETALDYQHEMEQIINQLRSTAENQEQHIKELKTQIKMRKDKYLERITLQNRLLAERKQQIAKLEETIKIQQGLLRKQQE